MKVAKVPKFGRNFIFFEQIFTKWQIWQILEDSCRFCRFFYTLQTRIRLDFQYRFGRFGRFLKIFVDFYKFFVDFGRFGRLWCFLQTFTSFLYMMVYQVLYIFGEFGFKFYKIFVHFYAIRISMYIWQILVHSNRLLIHFCIQTLISPLGDNFVTTLFT